MGSKFWWYVGGAALTGLVAGFIVRDTKMGESINNFFVNTIFKPIKDFFTNKKEEATPENQEKNGAPLNGPEIVVPPTPAAAPAK